MKTQSKSLMDMTDTEIRKVFDRPVKSLQFMDLGIQIEKAAAAHYDSMLANSFSYHLYQKKPIKSLCVFILECYKDNPEAVVDILGETLLNKIKTTLYED